MNNPAVSIITIVRNARQVVADSLTSVAAQNFALEHIIIDGASTDGTLAILREYEMHENQRKDRIVSIVSEQDKGIYDAMNKGIRRARGNIVGMLNADDFYADADIVAEVARAMEAPEIKILYGDLEYVKTDNPARIVRHWHSGEFKPRRFYWGWMPPHPTFFVKKECYRQYGTFNLDLGSAADYELMLRFMFKKQIAAVYLPRVLVKMRVGGVSNISFKNRMKANLMDRKAWKVNGLRPYPWTLYCKPLRKIHQFAFGLNGGDLWNE